MNKETTTSTQTASGETRRLGVPPEQPGAMPTATTSGGPPEGRPLWQQISGIDPQTESEMPRAERNAALRKLVAEVTARAKVEFADEDEGDIPDGERTIFWDPLQRICMQLGISRTKLSAYSRELTGMRAHEISDRILAKRKLMERLSARVEQYLRPELEILRAEIEAGEFAQEMLSSETWGFVRWMKGKRKFELSASFAAEMGFANYSRLNRACLLAFGQSLDQIEGEMVCTYVQKFFEELLKKQKSETPRAPRRQERREPPRTEEVKLTPQAEDIIRDAVAHTLGIKKEEVRVA